MGTTYHFYLEGLVDGKWECACPKEEDAEEGTLFIHSIINGKSLLRGIADEYCDKPAADVSDILKTYYGGGTYKVFDMAKAQKYVAAHFREHSGYVEKSLVQDYQDSYGEIFSEFAINEWLTVEEFRALDAESQKAYMYFEWSNRYEHLNILREIFIIAEKYKEIFENPYGANKHPTIYRIVVGIG